MPFRGHPIGGHIHFSQIQLTTDLLHALDTYLAIPDLLVEGSHRSRRRRRRYGYLGEYRLEGHGGFEYRTLSSWITTIHRAQATLSLAKIIAVEYPRLKTAAHRIRSAAGLLRSPQSPLPGPDAPALAGPAGH